MKPSLLRRTIAAACVASIGFVLSAAPALAEAPPRLDGRVFQQDGVTPRDGVVVALYDAATEQTYRSAPSDERGRFTIDSAPVGEYSVLAQTAQGAYLADTSLPLSAGNNPPVSLSIAQIAPAAAADGSNKSIPKWAQGLIAGAVVVAALFVINEITEDKEEDASAF